MEAPLQAMKHVVFICAVPILQRALVIETTRQDALGIAEARHRRDKRQRA